MNFISSFFIFSSGVVTSILKRCPSDFAKYQGIGATIFFTGLFSAIAAGYALYTVFHAYIPAIIFALIWGMMIFNLDRYIVSGMRKKSNFVKEMAVALPRIVLAIFIGVVIATPLELKLFESEIQAELVNIRQESYKGQEDLVRQRFDTDTKVINDELTLLRGKLYAAENEKITKLNEAIAEADGSGGSKIRNMGKIFTLKSKAAEKAAENYELTKMELLPKIEEQEQKLAAIDERKLTELTNMEKATMSGFASRLKALHRLSAKDEAIKWAGLFLTILFLIIECAPILVKLISEKSPYDQRLEILEMAYHLQNQKVNTFAKLKNDAEIEFERKTTGFKASETVLAENEVFAHALRQEKERLIQENQGWFALLRKKKIFDY